MYKYKKTQVSPYDPTKLAIFSILRPEGDPMSKCGQNFKRTVSFNDIVHFIDEDNIVTYVVLDCGITLYPETPAKIWQNNRKRNYISRSWEKPKCIPCKDEHHCSINEQHNSGIFLNPTIYGTWFQQLLCHSTTLMIEALWSISTSKQQLTNLQDSYPVFSSLPTMNSKTKGLRINFAFFQKFCILDGRLNETVATVEELSDLWKPGAMDTIPPSVMNCNCI